MSKTGSWFPFPTLKWSLALASFIRLWIQVANNWSIRCGIHLRLALRATWNTSLLYMEALTQNTLCDLTFRFPTANGYVHYSVVMA